MRGDEALIKAKEIQKKDQKLIYDTTLIKITDRLDYDWGMVTDYKTDKLVYDSEDEKHQRKQQNIITYTALVY